MSSRTWAVIVFVALVAAFIAVTAALTPWRERPPTRAEQLAALGSLPADHVARGKAFAAARRPATYLSMIVGLVAALLLGLTPAGARIVTAAAAPFGGGWFARAVVGGLVLVVLLSVVTVPFGAWRHAISRRFGLTAQGWGGWAVDRLKGLAVGAVLGAVALGGFYSVVRVAPRTWWAWAAVGAAALVVLLSFVVPVVIEPVFNKFAPMPDSALRDELLALARQDGVPVRDVLVADASRRTKAVNAYVSGFGATRRIVVYDTLLAEAPEAEVRGVVAHELGHASDRDVLTATVAGALGVATGVVGVYLLGSWPWLLRRAGVTDIADPRGLALLIGIFTVLLLVATPLQNLVSRRVEARADTHALRLTGDPGTFERMQARLAELNLANVDPNRFEYVMFASHPSTVQRIAAAQVWPRAGGVR